jgi:hypothetical protein
MSERHVDNKFYKILNSYSYFVWQMHVSVNTPKCSCPYLCAEQHSMTYVALFYFVRQSISDYAKMPILPPGIMPSRRPPYLNNKISRSVITVFILLYSKILHSKI